MNLNLARLQGLFVIKDGTWTHQGSFVDFAVRSRDIPSAVAAPYAHIFQDVWNCLSLVERLEWTNQEARRGRLAAGRYYQWATLDIEHFHVEVRSVYDYVAKCIGAVAARPGSVPTGSFEKLYNWVVGSKSRGRLDTDLAELIRSAEHFVLMRGVRNSIVHQGGHTMVFMDANDGILFQVHQNLRRLVSVHGLMFNDNVVYFRRYAALVLGSSLLLLERLAEVLTQRLGPKTQGVGPAWSTHGGISDFLVWVDELRAAMEAGN